MPPIRPRPFRLIDRRLYILVYLSPVIVNYCSAVHTERSKHRFVTQWVGCMNVLRPQPESQTVTQKLLSKDMKNLQATATTSYNALKINKNLSWPCANFDDFATCVVRVLRTWQKEHKQLKLCWCCGRLLYKKYKHPVCWRYSRQLNFVGRKCETTRELLLKNKMLKVYFTF